ncbi:MAG: hypothetical protein KKG33_15410 [candidate division Zixibacteria bacterium]|nr:hypothetical protein [candidate division Zixibacteria bacterium]MBU1471962.1 hypothetical protein [candidate division Zixibacteria bacterium]MBU2626937.1 hypothetical protein [candidate division Zixibacteria bacterium]
MSDLKLYSVNWKDGMLITQQHLKDQESYFEDLARWHNLDVADSYGLVRKSLSGKPALSIDMMASGDKLRVTITRCQALTPNGSYIDISESEKLSLKAETDLTDGPMPVYISVKPSEKREVGDPDPEEEIPRMPYLAAGYGLHLGKRPNMPESMFVQVAELKVTGSEAHFSVGYCPPCVTINADENLLKTATDFRNRLESLLSLSSRAFAAITTEGLLAGEKTDLQAAFKDTVFLMAYHISSTLDSFVLGRNASHPLSMVVHFKSLFRVLATLLNLQPGLKDYLNEKHFTKERSTDVGRFMAAIDSFLLSEYDHQNIRDQVGMIDSILSDLRGVLGFLAQIRKDELGREASAEDSLTYNNRTYRLVPFQSCNLEQVGELSYLLINIENPQAVSDTVVLMSKDLFSTAEWTNMQVRFGVNEARGLGETDPVKVDAVTFGAKVALRPQDMLQSPSVNKVTLIFRGVGDPKKFSGLGKLDLMIYAV